MFLQGPRLIMGAIDLVVASWETKAFSTAVLPLPPTNYSQVVGKLDPDPKLEPKVSFAQFRGVT